MSNTTSGMRLKDISGMSIDSAIGLKKKISNDVLNEYLHLVGHYNGNAIVNRTKTRTNTWLSLKP